MFKNKRGQIAPFMTLVLIITILAIGATMLIGENVYNKVRMINTTDSALISAATDLARAMNLIRQMHYRMLLNYIKLQVMLLSRGIWPGKSAAVTFALQYAQGVYENKKIYDQAKQMAAQAVKDARISVYDRILGGLIDEPKVGRYGSLASIFTKKPEELRPKDVDWQYLVELEPAYITAYRGYKKDHPEWWKEASVSYSWNRAKPECKTCDEYTFKAGQLGFDARQPYEQWPEKTTYDSYLKINIGNFPSEIKPKPKFMVLFFLWRCGTSVCPGFLPHPWAWISRISIPGGSRLAIGTEKMAYRTFPFFLEEPHAHEDYEKREIRHTSSVSIKGSIGSGYDVRMQ